MICSSKFMYFFFYIYINRYEPTFTGVLLSEKRGGEIEKRIVWEILDLISLKLILHALI